MFRRLFPDCCGEEDPSCTGYPCPRPKGHVIGGPDGFHFNPHTGGKRWPMVMVSEERVW